MCGPILTLSPSVLSKLRDQLKRWVEATFNVLVELGPAQSHQATTMQQAAGTWLQDMARALEACPLTGGADGSIPMDAFLVVMECIPPVYDTLFTYPRTVMTIKRDIYHGAQSMREAAAEVPPPSSGGATVKYMIFHELRVHGVEGIRQDRKCGSHSLLWLNRASSFLCSLVRGIHSGKEPKVAASDAYKAILEPFHGWVTKKLQGTAMGLCPSKEAILANLGLFSEVEASAQLEAFLRLMEPLNAAVLPRAADEPRTSHVSPPSSPLFHTPAGARAADEPPARFRRQGLTYRVWWLVELGGSAAGGSVGRRARYVRASVSAVRRREGRAGGRPGAAGRGP